VAREDDGVTVPPPNVGDEIYVPWSWAILAGRSVLLHGGLAAVTRVWTDQGRTLVEVAEHPNCIWDWDDISQSQEILRVNYGNRRSGSQPLGR